MKPFTSPETWTSTNLRQHLVEHYAQMALNLATLDQARWSTKNLKDDPTGLWIGIEDEIAARLKELENEKEIQTKTDQS
jgi:hypothetical protein